MKVYKDIKNLSSLIIFIVAMCCFFSCNDQRKEEIKTITINPKAKNDKLNIKIKSVIQFETSDTTLIGNINTIKFYKNKYYIFDQNLSKTLFVFDSEGKFINKTRLGKGPGEVIEPWCFCINELNNTILFWDQMTFNLNIYDLNLSFIESINCPNIAIRNLTCLDNSSFLILSQFFPIINGEESENIMYDYFVYHDNFKKLTKKIHITDPRTDNITMDNPICQTKQNFFIAPMDNIVYELTKGYDTKPFYKFDLGKYQVTDKDLNKGTIHYRSEMKRGNRICSLCNLLINETFISISYSFKNKTEFCIFNKESLNIINSNDLTLEKQLPICEIKGLLEDNTFIGISNAMDFNKFLKDRENTNSELESIDDFSNQIMIMFTVG